MCDQVVYTCPSSSSIWPIKARPRQYQKPSLSKLKTVAETAQTKFSSSLPTTTCNFVEASQKTATRANLALHQSKRRRRRPENVAHLLLEEPFGPLRLNLHGRQLIAKASELLSTDLYFHLYSTHPAPELVRPALRTPSPYSFFVNFDSKLETTHFTPVYNI